MENFGSFPLKFFNHVTNPQTAKSFFSDIYKFSNFYHVVLHKSVFQSFYDTLDSNIIIFYISPLVKEDHAHLFCYSTVPLKSYREMKTTTLENLNHMRCLGNNLFDSEQRHDFICKVTFGVSSLKSISIEKNLKSWNYLHHMEFLNMPKSFREEHFLQSKSNFFLPEYYSLIYNLNCENFFQVDYIHNKDFVVWFQNQENLVYPYKFIVKFWFVVHDENIFMCQKCINFETKSDFYIRKYILIYNSSNFNDIVQSPTNWCHGCKQVPLFQIMNTEEIYKQYRCNSYNFCMENILKLEFFENGIKKDLRKLNCKTQQD